MCDQASIQKSKEEKSCLMELETQTLDKNVFQLANPPLSESTTAKQQPAFHDTEAGKFLAGLPKISTLTNTTPNWIIPGLIVKGSFHLITGEPGSMKSMFALYLAKLITAGQDFSGTVSTAQDVFYFDRENPACLICERYSDMDIQDETRLHYSGTWSGKSSPPESLDSRVYGGLAQEFRPVFIFDSLIRFSGGRDENDAAAMGQIMKRYRTFCSQGATVILIHHRGKRGEGPPSTYRGSSEINAACDIGLSIDKDGTTLNMQQFKNRFEPENAFKFRFDDDTGIFILESSGRPTASLADQVCNAILSNPGIDVNGLSDNTRIAEKRLRRLLKDGEGRRWRVSMGNHGRQQFFPIDPVERELPASQVGLAYTETKLES
jgi:hypothetical protein